MHSIKRITAICLSLLVLMMNFAKAEMPFLVHSNGWNLDNTPVEVKLSADVDVHMPFDEDRLAMLTPILDKLSLKLVTGEALGAVAIAFDDQELLSLQYRDNAVQLSSMPGASFTADENALALLLGSEASIAGGYEALGLSSMGESLMTDGRALLSKIPDAFADAGKRSNSDTNISGYGQSAYRMDYTFTEKNAKVMQDLLLSVCPEGWLRDIIANLSFSGKQTLRMYFTKEDVLLRAEYNGSCGPEGDLRTVKLVVRTLHDDQIDKDYVELTSPAKKGKNKNSLTFERVIQTNRKGERTVEGSYSYTVTADGVTNTRKGAFALVNAFTEGKDVITGSASFQSKLGNAEKFTELTIQPELTISGSETDPEISGKLTVTEEYAGRTTEHAVISIALKAADGLDWETSGEVIALDLLDAEHLANVRQQVAASIASALVQPMIVMMGEEAVWFFRDLPEEAVQSIIDAAEMRIY